MKLLNSIGLIDTGLIPNRKNSKVFQFCVDNNIKTVDDFLQFVTIYEISGKLSYELNGLYNLLNYKYLNIVDKEYLNILNTTLTKVQEGVRLNRIYSRSDLELLRKLGLTFEEVKVVYYFAHDCKNKRIIDVLNKIINPKNSHIYLGANLDKIFMEKINLICKYYYLKNERKEKYINGIENELEDLILKKNKVQQIKYNVLKQQTLLKSLEIKIEEKEKLLDEMIEEKKLLQK